MIKKNVSDLLAGRSRRMRWTIALLFVLLLALQAGAFALVIGLIWGESQAFWLPELLIASAFLLAGGLLAIVVVARQQRKTASLIGRAAQWEKHSLAMARNQATALKALAAAVGSARDVQGLFDVTLDIYQLVLYDFGVPVRDQAAAIYLLADDHLAAAATSGVVGLEEGAPLERHQGLPDRTLAKAELQISQQPDQDPALSELAWLKGRQQVMCAPLCTSHGLYGLVLLATNETLTLAMDQKELLEAIADQVALALRNFQLQQSFESTRMDDLTAEEEERQVLRLALHQGPAQSAAAVALRLGLIRSMMIKDPDQAAQELAKIEHQARRSSEGLKDLVSLLRPLDLGVKDLNWAVDVALQQIEDEWGLTLRLGRREPDQRLDPQTLGVILYVLQSTLAWARKYGQATAAEISYWPEDDAFHVTIDDDGYNQAQDNGPAVTRADALATELMQARVQRLGGRLDVQPKAGRGVSTVMVAPLSQQGLPPGT